MVGLPGSGKSTFISNITKNISPRKVAVCSADHYWMVDGEYRFELSRLGEAHKFCQNNFIAALNNKDVEYIFVDNTNLRQRDRSFYYKKAFEYGACVKAVVFEYNVELSIQRNIHNVPAETIKNMNGYSDLTTPGVFVVLESNETFTHNYVGRLLNEFVSSGDNPI